MSQPLATANLYLHMRLPAFSSMRFSGPLRRACQHSIPVAQLRAQLFHSRAHLVLRGSKPVVVATIGIQAWNARWRSTSPDEDRSVGSGQRQQLPRAAQQRLPFLRLLLRAVGGSVRSLFIPFKGQTLRTLYRQNPGELVLALAVLVVSVLVFAYIVRIYFTYFYSRQFTRYPPPVAKYLRRALYFSNYSPDPKRALKNYKLALEQCDVLGLDPFSDDVLGIRIQIASWLEKLQSYDAAIKILEVLLADLKRWVDLMDKGARGGTIKNDVDLSSRLPPRLLKGKEKAEGHDEDDASEAETLWGRRSRILRKAIGVSVKLGELYSDDHVLDADLAHQRLVWSVNTALKEYQRRTVDGIKEGEGEWMTPKEMGAALESLGHNYESRSQFHLALPLFFQALRLCSDPCHSAVIMNNLAVSFAQHQVQAPYETLVGSVMEKTDSIPTQEEARKAYLQTARRWALNAKQHATDTTGTGRTPECDEACAVSLCNLGDIAAMLGDFGEARQHFEDARTMSEKLNFQSGIKQAQEGLGRLPPE